MSCKKFFMQKNAKESGFGGVMIFSGKIIY